MKFVVGGLVEMHTSRSIRFPSDRSISTGIRDHGLLLLLWDTFDRIVSTHVGFNGVPAARVDPVR